jgi:hypothetical protein
LIAAATSQQLRQLRHVGRDPLGLVLSQAAPPVTSLFDPSQNQAFRYLLRLVASIPKGMGIMSTSQN